MKKKVLLVIESCNPEWASVPLVGYNFFNQISGFADVTLVTHERNKDALNKVKTGAQIIYIHPSKLEKIYYRLITRLSTFKGAVIWPLRHALQYPIYFFFDRNVETLFRDAVNSGQFDIVHALTPILPRYPVKISRWCRDIPFLLGPVNGGVPFPPAFRDRGKKEFAQLNFLRKIGAAVIPNYHSTYQIAKLVLAGSSYTKKWLQDNLRLRDEKVELFFENGITDAFFKPPREQGADNNAGDTINALFIGRLVPYKGADLLLRAISQTKQIHLTIVGDGSERRPLQELAVELGLTDRVIFTGWIPQNETAKFYQSADIFCFPSVREFGGAVVMEAMAAGLPCIVVDNGGIGEYVDETCGYKIAPASEKYVTDEMARILNHLVTDRRELQEKATAAFQKAATFSWQKKGEQLAEIYQRLTTERDS